MSSNPANNPSRCLGFGAHGRQHRQGSGWHQGRQWPCCLARAGKTNKGNGPLVLSWPPEKAVGFGWVLCFWFLIELLGVTLHKKTSPSKLTWRSRKDNGRTRQEVTSVLSSPLRLEGCSQPRISLTQCRARGTRAPNPEQLLLSLWADNPGFLL